MEIWIMKEYSLLVSRTRILSKNTCQSLSLKKWQVYFYPQIYRWSFVLVSDYLWLMTQIAANMRSFVYVSIVINWINCKGGPSPLPIKRPEESRIHIAVCSKQPYGSHPSLSYFDTFGIVSRHRWDEFHSSEVKSIWWGQWSESDLLSIQFKYHET